LSLFLGPRYEFALLSGLLGPFIVALAVAWVFAANESSARRAARVAATATGILLLLAFVGSFVEGNCEPALGYGLLLLGPGVGFLGVALGASFAIKCLPARLQARRVPRLGVALCVPLAVLIYGLVGLYRGPALYAYSEFAGYFAGPLYDLVDYRLDTLLSYRAGSVLLLVALTLGSWGQVSRGLSVVRRRASVGFFVCYGAYRGLGPSLGHELTEGRLAEILAGQVEGARCRVRYDPSQTARKSAKLVLRQCEADLRSVADYFATPVPESIVVSLFASVEEKGRITGAGRTSVAKPWRSEVHVQEAGFPHPILRHEIAHVVAAGFGRGPFRVAGSLGGLVPDPGRIEGFAVAAAPGWASDGTLLEWASAQSKLGKMPPLRSLFQVSFYGSSAVSAYGASGAFVAFVKERYGSEKLRRWYAGESLDELLGISFQELEHRFLARLAEVEVPAVVLRAARERYAALAVGERHCPHAVDRALGRAQAQCELDPELAREQVELAVRLDPTERDATLWLSSCFLAAGRVEEGQKLLESYSSGPEWSLREKELGLADIENVRHARDEAERAYVSLLARATSSAEARALELRLWALGKEVSPESQELVLVGLVKRLSDEVRLAELAALAQKAPDTFLSGYLLGRALFRAGFWKAAETALRSALPLEAPLPELRREALRVLLTSSCALGDLPSVRQVDEIYRSQALTENQRLELDELRAICP
jgi:tetratricopeptide (TPR) repeat protein